jgi:FAD/FMN-containing dehydrogenase
MAVSFDHDFFVHGATPARVAAPQTIEAAIAELRAAAAERLVVVPRGGGMSYTGGYISDGAMPHLLLDLRGLDRIDLAHVDDGIAIVEAGVTWQQLWESLRQRGYRAHFWGPLSGLSATVGGALSQNAAFWGSGRAGCAGDAALGFEIALADGERLRPGVRARGSAAGAPAARHFGPDLTQLFVGDCGRFGVKLRVALAVQPLAAASGSASFSFESAPQLLAAMTAIAREELVAQQVGFDPLLANLRSRRQSLGEDFRNLTRVLRGGRSMLQGLRDAANVTLAGRGYLANAGYTLHAMCEARSATMLAEQLAAVTQIATAQGARAIENSIPTVMTAAPFTPLNGIIGPNGERWVPVHGLFAPSKAAAAYATYIDVLGDGRETLDREQISSAALFASVGSATLLIEPMFFWPDALDPLHDATLEEKVRRRLTPRAANPQARAAVAALRRQIVDAWRPLGAGHLQVGRTYPFAATLDATQQRVFEGLLQTLDPASRSNPGALGLGAPAGTPPGSQGDRR